MSAQAEAADERTFETRRIGGKDRHIVLQFLRKFFYHDEPLNTAIGLKRDSHCQELEDFSLGALDEGLSLGAFAEDGSMVGVCVNAAVTRQEDEESRREWEQMADRVLEDVNALQNLDDKFSQLKRLLMYAGVHCELFRHGPADLDRAFDIFILSVDSSWRGKGIAKKLLDQSRETAQAEGYRLMRIICTSYVSALISARLGYRAIDRIEYKTIVDRKGQRIFHTEAPHEAIVTCVLDI